MDISARNFHPSNQGCIGTDHFADYKYHCCGSHTFLYSLYQMILHHMVDRNDDLQLKVK